MESFADIIEQWPSAVAFGEDLGVKDVTARSWKWRGIPAEYWSDVVAAARHRGIPGITYELLARLAAARRRDRAQAEDATAKACDEPAHSYSADVNAERGWCEPAEKKIALGGGD